MGRREESHGLEGLIRVCFKCVWGLSTRSFCSEWLRIIDSAEAGKQLLLQPGATSQKRLSAFLNTFEASLKQLALQSGDVNEATMADRPTQLTRRDRGGEHLHDVLEIPHQWSKSTLGEARESVLAYSLLQDGRFEALVVQFDSEVDVEAKEARHWTCRSLHDVLQMTRSRKSSQSRHSGSQVLPV